MKHQQTKPKGKGLRLIPFYCHIRTIKCLYSFRLGRQEAPAYIEKRTPRRQVVIGNDGVVPNGQRSRSQPKSPETASIFFALVLHPRKNRSELIIKLRTNKASGRLKTSFLNRLGRECRTSGKDILIILWTRPQKRDVKPSALKHAFCFRSYRIK